MVKNLGHTDRHTYIRTKCLIGCPLCYRGHQKPLGDTVPEVSIGVKRNLGIIKSELSNANKEFDISHVLKAKKMEH